MWRKFDKTEKNVGNEFVVDVVTNNVDHRNNG